MGRGDCLLGKDSHARFLCVEVAFRGGPVGKQIVVLPALPSCIFDKRQKISMLEVRFASVGNAEVREKKRAAGKSPKPIGKWLDDGGNGIGEALKWERAP